MSQPFHHEEPNDIPSRLENIDKKIARYEKYKKRVILSRILAIPALKTATHELDSLSYDLSDSTIPTAAINRAEVITRQHDLGRATPMAAMNALRASIHHIRETNWGKDKLEAQEESYKTLRQLIEIEGDDEDTSRHLKSVD